MVQLLARGAGSAFRAMPFELITQLAFAVLLALFSAMTWGGAYLLRARKWGRGAAGLVSGVIFLLAYAWIARGLYISSEVDLELAESRYGRSREASLDWAREEYERSGRIAEYQDEKSAWRSFSPSREDRIRRERREARMERLRRGMMMSDIARYAALAALPLAVLGGLLWPRRPTLPAAAEAAPAARRRWRPGVTLMEIAIVAAIIGVLAAISLSPEDHLPKASTVRHAAVRLEVIKPRIAEFRQRRNAWPEKNTDIELAETGYAVPEMQYSFLLQGDGAVLLKTRWGEVSFRPAVDTKGAIAWVCADEPVPAGFRVVGENRTTLARQALPGECRA